MCYFVFRMTESGFTPITKEIWDKILRHYLITYRGPNDEANIRRELDGFFVLTRTGRVAPGRFVRYMRKGILDNDLRRGGYVKRCHENTIRLQDGRREWSISRNDNYIFVGDAESEKSDIRKLCDKVLSTQSKKNYDDGQEDDDEEDVLRAPTVKVNFI
jgi:hypothetical protein